MTHPAVKQLLTAVGDRIEMSIRPILEQEAQRGDPLTASFLDFLHSSWDRKAGIIERILLAAVGQYGPDAARAINSGSMQVYSELLMYVKASFVVSTSVGNSMDYQTRGKWQEINSAAESLYAAGLDLITRPEPQQPQQSFGYNGQNAFASQPQSSFSNTASSAGWGDPAGAGRLNNIPGLNLSQEEPMARQEPAGAWTSMSGGNAGFKPSPKSALDDIFAQAEQAHSAQEPKVQAEQPKPQGATPMSDQIKLEEPDIRALLHTEGCIPHYNRQNDPKLFNPITKTRELYLEDGVYHECLSRGGNMDSYIANRMFTALAERVPERMHNPDEDVVAAVEAMTVPDYGVTDWDRIEEVTNPSSINDTLLLAGSHSRPILNRKTMSRTFIVTHEEQAALDALAEVDGTSFIDKILLYIAIRNNLNEEGHHVFSEQVVQLINARILDEINVRLNGSMGPLINNLADIEVTSEDMNTIFTNLERDMPGTMSKFDAKAPSLLSRIFKMSKEQSLVDSELITLYPDQTLSEGTVTTGYMTEFFDLHLPINSGELQIETMAEWNTVDSLQHPKLCAMLDQLLSAGGQSQRPVFRVYFTNGLILRVDRRWINEKGPMVKVIGYPAQWSPLDSIAF